MIGSVKKRRFDAAMIIVVILAVIWFLPIFIAVMNSFKSKGDILASAIAWPNTWNWDNYKSVVTESNFPAAFANSLFLTAGGVMLNLAVSTLAGYALARGRSKWAHVVTLLLLSSMFVPFHTIMISLVKVAKALHLTGKLTGLMVIYCGLQCPIPIFLIRGFVSALPKELEEAAQIDGCTTGMTFRLIVLPMLKPILSTVAVLNALWIWNDYLLPYLILAKPMTIPLSQMYFYGQYNQQWHLIMAGFVVSTIPVIVFFLIMQKNIMSGITSGAVKG